MAYKIIKIKNVFDDTLYGLAWTCAHPIANVIIITGMQETAERYDEFARYLNANHFDVYCIDHYGQGLNIAEGDIPGIWPVSGFSKTVKTFGEVEALLQQTGLPTYIIGHSMGSFIVQDFIQRFNGRVSKVVICGSDFPKPFLMHNAYYLSKLLVHKNNRDVPNKTLAKLVTGKFSKAVKNPRTDFDWLSYNKDSVNQYIKDPKCGFIATGGFYREFLKGMSRVGERKFLRKVRKGTEILIIAGSEDPVGHIGKGPTKLAKAYNRLGVRHVELKIYPHMRHEILNEKKREQVYEDIVKFLKNKE